MDNDDDFLMISGIQHFAFCPRQWALIHIEQQWKENVLTTEGNHIHRRVDVDNFDETRGQFRIVRSVPLISNELRIRGIADMVEFTNVGVASDNTVSLKGRTGHWTVLPIEYKRGRVKFDDRDAVQLCAQAICLEEMLGIHIGQGIIYYAETRKRESIQFTVALRERVFSLVSSMREFYDEARTPRAVFKKHCLQCSLITLCQPKWSSQGSKSALDYVRKQVESGY